MKIIGGKKISTSAVIAVCGNPNCGKTTIFNAITGLNQHVGNYPGVTVEKVVGQFNSSIYDDQKVSLVDIPGTYSLSAFTPDEYIAASALFGEIEGEEQPDGIVAVLDATNLERGFYFLFQILEIGCPVIVALNMVDLAKKRGLEINAQKLSEKLGIDVIEVIGNKGVGIELLKDRISKMIGTSEVFHKNDYGRTTEELIESLNSEFGNIKRSRAQHIRIIFDINGEAEKKFLTDEDPAAKDILEQGRRKIKEKVGALTIAETHQLTNKAQKLFNEVVYTGSIKARTRSEKIDKYLLHPVLGPIILAVIMVGVFQSIFSWAEPFMNIIDGVFSSLAGVVDNNMSEGPLRSLLTDGIIGGVGSVLIFIPQIVFLFMFIAFLEDSGYMPRAAFLVDRMFRWCGLSGKSFIPMLSSFACAVPGIMATRTIEDRQLRLMTITIAPLMTCSARLPIYTIMIAAFIPYQMVLGFVNLQGLVLALLYLLGIVMAIVISYILKKTVYKTERGTFMMEMPSYKIPTLKSVLIRVYNRAKSFVLRAGTVILAITIIIWALSYYPRSENLTEQYNQDMENLKVQFNNIETEINQNLENIVTTFPISSSVQNIIIDKLSESVTNGNPEEVKQRLLNDYPEDSEFVLLHFDKLSNRLNYENSLADLSNGQAGLQIRNSYFGKIGQAVEPLFKPLGWDWKITMSVLASFPAREVIIAILGTIYNLGSDVNEESSTLIEKMRMVKWEDGDKIGQPVFSPAVALSIMVFFALCCQCGATLVTVKQETNRWIYPIFIFIYMTVLAYTSSFVVYQLFNSMGL